MHAKNEISRITIDLPRVEHKRLKALGDQWQSEIDEKQVALDKMYKNYDAEQFMLSDDLKKKREEELFVKEKELRDLQKRRFGYTSMVFYRALTRYREKSQPLPVGFLFCRSKT